MPFTPGPYSGVSTLALVTRASVFGFGVVYGSIKLSILKATKPKKEEAHAHH
uniref:ATP synthase subunit e, mitochondrial n=1 Tax=Zea mays TaxID=4577 RepID=A0A804RG64_MAIZE